MPTNKPLSERVRRRHGRRQHCIGNVKMMRLLRRGTVDVDPQVLLPTTSHTLSSPTSASSAEAPADASAATASGLAAAVAVAER